jgi:hypothetical protein
MEQFSEKILHSKIPITKSQISNKFQLPNNQTMFGHWNLDIDYYLIIGA